MLDAMPMHHDGVGGVEMVTFGELAHMQDATQLCFLCPWMMNKDREHSTMHPSVSQYVFMWCLSCSLDSPDPQRFLEELEKSCCDKKKTSHCAVTSSRCENMSGSISFRFRENSKSSIFVWAKCPFSNFCL